MTWFFIALINPIAHALVNHLDKYLISKYFKSESVGALILFSSLFAVLALPVIYVIDAAVLSAASWTSAFILAVNGALLVVAIILYLYALRDNEASYVAPFFQLVPFFSLILGYFLLGEWLTHRQILAGVLLVCGSLFLSVELKRGVRVFNSRLLILMLGSSIFYAINAVIFKLIATEDGFMFSLFWDMIGKVVIGVLIFIFIASYRQQFLEVFKKNGIIPVTLNSMNEVLALVGEVALVYAVMLAPVALVQSIGGLQPTMVLILGFILTLFFPNFVKESFHGTAIIQKVFGIIVITTGVLLL